MFKLHIETDNAAFDEAPAEQLADTLIVLADQIRHGHRAGRVRDVNGNTIGNYDFNGVDE